MDKNIYKILEICLIIFIFILAFSNLKNINSIDFVNELNYDKNYNILQNNRSYSEKLDVSYIINLINSYKIDKINLNINDEIVIKKLKKDEKEIYVKIFGKIYDIYDNEIINKILTYKELSIKYLYKNNELYLIIIEK